ncbi:putative Adenylate/Guanylate cyclase [Bradyrhizobium sp. ORS 285]|uniref:adenylate/guanylate cyclase domain-containing protein n=1 Tax=Bradyrhizobium sp. ORS 285 TaxID=115808 RepID=UPI000240A536|nr:adenylate/guanylate cyclase domain-containing protein [Bradyrhizobium sp. ORS 285]CCD84101.1 putative Adenylate/Guanylate cyclase [Bradyrhizobium sp. ORS 285]SMX59923.1 putative Adenylate/Guanylate cyclase [Bradyrhizobium sp. ORS 285]
MDISKLQDIKEWLVDGARSTATPSEMMAECCARLVALGIPLWRVGVFVRTLHPDIAGRSFIWRQGGEVEMGTVAFGFESSPAYRDSPLARVFEQGTEFRADPRGPLAEQFPILMDLRAEGVTDYVSLPLTFIDRAIHAASWTTRSPDGFTEEQLNAIRSLAPALARYTEIVTLRRTASMLLDTYVGNSAGERILGGQIRRGHTDAMDAAIWLSDLRGFTPLSDRLPAEDVVEILNQYFDCQVEPIREQGGEVLKFMGDGLLAVFPIRRQGGDPAEVCSRVLTAARASRARVDALEYAAGGAGERFRFGVALHVGRLLYGNIGGGNRLDFTCIGPAVNLAARLEKIAAKLKRTVVASEAFAGACPEPVTDLWTDLGEFPIAGLSTEQRVFGLREETN